MKHLKYIYLIPLLMLLLQACGSKQSEQIAEEEAEEAEIQREDSLIRTQDNPTEDEIEALTDSAKQERQRALMEKYDGMHIYVSKSHMRLYVLDKTDSVLFTCGIACGIRRGNKQAKGDYRTPEGNFHISGIFNSTDWVHRTRDGRSVKGCYGPHFLRLATGRLGGIGIHGTNSPRSIGKRASEGCIRVLSENIVTIYKNYAYQGMPVTVGDENAPLPQFRGMPQETPKQETKAAKDSTTRHSAPEHSAEHATHERTENNAPAHPKHAESHTEEHRQRTEAAESLWD